MDERAWELLLQELKELNSEIHYVRKEMGNMKAELATLKGKASVWGFIAGVISSIGVALFGYFKH